MNYRLLLKSPNRRLQAFFRTVLATAVATWSTLAFSGEIHTAAMSGNAEKTTALLAGDPELVFSKDEHGSHIPHFGSVIFRVPLGERNH